MRVTLHFYLTNKCVYIQQSIGLHIKNIIITFSFEKVKIEEGIF